MCILILTRGDGTTFDASSIQEEDVIKICLQLGHTHSEGVLQYSVIESVMLFILQMNCMLQCMGLWKQHLAKKPLELGLLCLLPPMWGPTWQWWVRILQAPNLWPQIGRRNPNYPLVTLTQVGGSHINCKWILGTLGMMSSDSSWRTFARRLLSENWMHPQSTTSNTFGKSSGKGGSWCGWLGGHLSERWRVGTCRTTSLTPCHCSTQWRCWMSYKLSGNRNVTWYPWYKHLQWWSHTRQDGSVFWTVVPWGTVDKRPLSQVSGHREYHMITKGGSTDMARYMGPTTSITHILQKFSYFWHSGVIWCTHAKLL